MSGTQQTPEIVRFESGKVYDESHNNQVIDLTTPLGQDIQQAASKEFGSLDEATGRYRWDADQRQLQEMTS